MATNLGVKLTMDSGSYMAALAKAQKETSRMADTVKKSSKAAGSGGSFFGKLVGLVSVGAVMHKIIQETQEAQAAQAQLGAVIKSTGGSAGVTAEAATELAAKLEALTAVDDDVIIGAEAVLLRFRNMSQDVFPAATQATLDLSAATGKDLNSSAIMVGKALDSLGQNTKALDKAGAGLTQTEKNQAKALAEAGDKAGAMKIVLDSLNRSVGGSAEAQAQTFGGALKLIELTAGKAAKTIGNELTPGLIVLSNTMARSSNNAGILQRGLEFIGQAANRVLVAIAYVIEMLDQKFGKENENLELTQKNYDRASDAAMRWHKEIQRLGGMDVVKEKAAKHILEAEIALGEYNAAMKAGNDLGNKSQSILAEREARLKKITDALDGLNKKQNESGKSAKSKDETEDDKAAKKLKETQNAIKQFVQGTISDIAGLVSGIGNIFNTISENQLKAFDQMKNRIDMMIDYSEQAALEAAGVVELTQAQSSAKQVRELQRQISKTGDLNKKKALQEQLTEERKNKTQYEIKEKYEKKKQQTDMLMDFWRMQLERRQFERNKGYQIANIWIMTAAAVTAAWLAAFQLQSSGGSVYVAAALGAVSTALLLANAGVQTANVAMQKAPMYERGAWEIPNTQMALLHQGEMVMPAKPAEQFRQGAGGGVNIHIYGTMIDGVKAIKKAFSAANIKLSTGGVY